MAIANQRPRYLRSFVHGIYGRVLLLFLAILLPILLVQAEIYQDRFHTRRQAERQTNLEVARGVAATFGQFVRSVWAQELAIGVTLTLEGTVAESEARRILNRSKAAFATIRNLGWISPQGKLLHASDPRFWGVDVSQRPSIQDIMAGRETGVSDLFVSPVTGKPTFTISRGIRNDDGKLLGVVVAAMAPQAIQGLYPNLRQRDRSYFLVDRRGRGVFLSSRADWPWEDRSVMQSLPAIQEALNGREQSGTQIADPEGVARMYAVTPIAAVGWAAGAGIPESKALAPIYAQLRKNAVLFLLVVALAMLLASLFALRTIGRPLRALQQFALDLSEHKFANRLRPVGALEFRDLGRTLNTMADEITRWTARSENAYRRLKVVLDTVPVGIVMARADTREISFANQEGRRIMGAPVDGATDVQPGSGTFATLDGTPLARKELPLYRSMKRGEIVSAMEIRVARADGGTRVVSVNAAPIRDKDDSIWGAVASMTDITAHKQIEETLRRSEEKFRTVFEQVAVGIGRVRFSDARWIEVNDTFCRMLGYTRDELLRTPWPRITHPEDVDLDLIPFRRMAAGELESYMVEKRFLHKLGHHVWARLTLSLVRDPRGRPDYEIAVVENIAEQKALEEALRKSEQQFREVFAHMPVGMVINDLEGRFIHVNEAYCRITGYSEAELLHAGFQDLTHPEDLDANLEEMQKLLAGDIPAFFVEKRYLRKDGTTVWVRASAALRRDADGNPAQIIGLVEDITERKHTEVALRLSEAKFRSAFHANPSLMVISSLDEGRLIEVNRAVEEVMGYPREEMIGRTTLELGIWFDAVQRRRVVDQIRAEGGIRDIETVLKTRNRERRTFLLSAETITIGDVPCFMSAWVDITGRKRMEEAVKASLTEKEVLLKEIHHRVKNNMQVISSLISLQQNDLHEEAMRPVFQDLVHRVRSMALVHEKLYQSPDLARVEFADYAEDLLGYLWRAHASSSGVRLALDLEPVKLSATSAVPCGLILNELVSNALKHAFAGRETGEVRVSLQNGTKGRVRLQVRDNGRGLPEGFDWRQSRSLGLRLVQMLEKQLHASVDVVVAEGTAFTITFAERTP